MNEASALFTQAYDLALRTHRPALAGRYLGNLGGLAFIQKQYQTACNRLLQAKQASERAGDSAGAAMELANLTTVYIQTGDMAAARAAAEQGLKDIEGKTVAPGTRVQLLCNLGTALGRQGEVQGAGQTFQLAIEDAAQSGQTALLGQAWDSLGRERLKRGALKEAEKDLLEAYRIQAPRRDPSLAATLSHLSELRQRQGDLRSAGQLIESAMSGGGGGVPLWYLYFRQGSILSARKRPSEALSRYRRAVRMARTWREEIAPSDSLRSSTAGWLNELYDPYIDELMAQSGGGAAETGRAMEAFAVTEDYRAAALRQTLSDSPAWRRNLPDEYWQTLNQLRDAEMQSIGTASTTRRAVVERLEQRMNEIEAREYTKKIGGSPSIPREKFLSRNTLSNIQRRLSPQELLLSFHFGERASYVWAIARDRAEVHRLGSSRPLKTDSWKFEAALESDSPDSMPLGRRLYAELLGGVSAPLRAKTEWIVAADDITVRLPWNALREPTAKKREEFVVAGHAIRFVPSGMSLARRPREPGERRMAGVFLGIGDGVYNRADPRKAEMRAGYGFGSAQAAVELPRLVGSGHELEVCARAWRGESRLLTGEDASRAGLIRELARKPAVVHIAAHVLQAAAPEESVIHLGLAPDGAPETLTRYDVANLAVAGSTVVMSGCASAAAPAPEGAGLLGLARAWLIAGADSVVGTRWPAPDDGGGLFEAFYRNLQGGTDVTVSRALRQAELEMLRSGSWRSKPRYWASFIVVGKE